MSAGGGRVVVVTGTDTGVGKTVVTAALAANALASGQRVAVLKPAQTGCAPGEPGDVAEVARLAGPVTGREVARYREPLAPATAARRRGDSGVCAREVAETARTLATDHDLVLVEGAGGLLVQLHTVGDTLADVAALLPARLVVVARAGLGTLNAAALTVEAARARELSCVGLVIGAWPHQPDLAERCNLRELPAVTGLPLLGSLPQDAARLEPVAFRAVAARTSRDSRSLAARVHC